MRHQKRGRKLGRTASHRRALLRNLVTELFKHESIRTTLPKAKEMRRYVDKMITFGKRGNLHARRMSLRFLTDKDVVQSLFDNIAPRFIDRNGGYTRIYKLGPRRGDGAEMAIIELVEKSEDKLEEKEDTENS
ncbi:MAG: 50S ribosomal protein L17 [Candidatus Cloacimonetes bacterium 4572_55]|nr:MAG: 50S ribosomal protein L17 [Candidatus Cloacimonetes bacterium 4572_55]